MVDDPVGTTRHNDGGVIVAAQVVNDLKKPAGRSRVERPPRPASGHGLLAATRTGPAPGWRNTNVHVSHTSHLHHFSLLSLPSHPLLRMSTNGLLRQRH